MDTRERLLEAAIELLERKGYARTTTREIVAEAGAHLPSVNYFFGSKEALLREAVVEALRRWGQTTMDTVAAEPPSSDARGRLERSVRRFLATLEQDRSYVVAALEAFAQAERSDELRAELAAAYEQFRDLVARSVEDSAGASEREPQPAAVAVATVLIAIFDGLAIQWLLNPEGSPSADQVIRGLDALALVLARPAGGGAGG